MRLYNGCPDDELAALWASRKAARKRAEELGCQIVWFPVEEKYAAHRVGDYEEASPFCSTVEECLRHVEAYSETANG